MSDTCEKTDCENPATGALAFRLYPFKALMKHYKTDQHLTQLILGLKLCEKCRSEVDPVTFLGAQLYPIAKTVERGSGVAVDLAGTKAVLVPFDDPDYLRLLKARETA